MPVVVVAADQRDPEVFLGPSVFGEACGTKATKPNIFKRRVVVWPFRQRWQGQQTCLFLKTCGCLGLGTPCLQKTIWPTTILGIPDFSFGSRTENDPGMVL
jgi:hypothetical protein